MRGSLELNLHFLPGCGKLAARLAGVEVLLELGMLLGGEVGVRKAATLQ